MPKIKLKDISLYYEIYGKGTPLLLIAGLASDSASWIGVIKDFAPYFQTIVFDNRGSGRSDVGDEGCTITLMAQDAIQMLDLLKIKQAHVLGHSMGGYIAQELAVNYPGRIAKLILGSTAPVSSKRNNILYAEMYNRLKKEGHSEAFFRMWADWLFSPGRIADSSFIEVFIKNTMKYPYLQGPDGFKNQIDAIASFDARDKIKAIKAKTLILEGKSDILITPQESEILAGGINNSVFKLLDGVAHCMHMENPGLFTDTVLQFLNSAES